MTVETPLVLRRLPVARQWIDDNGHMNDAAYCLVFSQTTDALIDHIGKHAEFRRDTATTIYTAEFHVCYVQEAGIGDDLVVDTHLLEHDHKRLRVLHAMRRGRDGSLLATSEQTLLCIDTTGPRTTPFTPEIQTRLQALRVAHRPLPMPEQAGRAISLRG